jgi:phytoene synthase
VLNEGEPVEPGDAAGHLGVAQALTGHLRSFGRNAASGRIFLPMPIFAANGVTEREILTGTPSEGLLEALAQFAAMARGHLAKAEAALAVLPAGTRAAFALLALLPAQISAVEKNSEAPFSPPPEAADWLKIARLVWWASRKG